MNKLKHYILLLLLLPSVAISSEKYFWVRGEAWDVFNNSTKLAYVSGYMDGLIFSEDKVKDVYLGGKLSNKQYVEALNQFYKDYKNTYIPAPFAFKVITLELTGADKTKIEKTTINMRAQFAPK